MNDKIFFIRAATISRVSVPPDDVFIGSYEHIALSGTLFSKLFVVTIPTWQKSICILFSQSVEVEGV